MEIARDASGSRSKAGLRNWLADLGLDTAKLGLLLYVLGLLASNLYYSRFSILTLDLAKTQCILVGVYIVLLYAVAPAITLFAAKGIRSATIVSVWFVIVLCLLDLILGLAVGLRRFSLFGVAFLTAALQFFCFTDFTSLGRSLRARRQEMAFMLPPPRAKAMFFALAFCLHFSLSWFPRIPGYLGGAKPLPVQVFTKTPDLPANRFVVSKNHPQINKSIDSFALHLLYETDKDAYFVYDLQAEDNLVGYSVMRLKKDEIVRIDYNTPKWVRWRSD